LPSTIARAAHRPISMFFQNEMDQLAPNNAERLKAYPIFSKSSTENYDSCELAFKLNKPLALTSCPLTIRVSGSAFINHGMLSILIAWKGFRNDGSIPGTGTRKVSHGVH